MKYEEFLAWCNHRASDGCWSSGTAIFCINIISEVKSQTFWRRERKWQELEKEYGIVENVVNPINNKIKEIYG